ncbi:MAG: hypothetical protein WAU88_01035 [Candidatus Zixiibacteriota bacterium]
MVDFLQIESESHRLRQALRMATTAETRLRCILQFFDHHHSLTPSILEPFVREFAPLAASLAAGITPHDLLPEDAESLSRLSAILEMQRADTIPSSDRDSLDAAKRNADTFLSAPQHHDIVSSGAKADKLSCLFVEHYPELGLEPRGRILTLAVTASRSSGGTTADIVGVHGPSGVPDDAFIAQARRSVAAARTHLEQRGRIKQNEYFRVEFVLDSTSVRFTGDSLGLALAVGAVAAIMRSVIARELLMPDRATAFTGALSENGAVEPVDVRGLRLKIYRALFSNLTQLVVPRAQLAEATEYLAELRQRFPTQTLTIIGAVSLAEIVEDAQLVAHEPMPATTYAFRKATRYGSTPWVGGLVAVLLGVMLFIFLFRLWDKSPSRIRTTEHGFEVLNRYGYIIWSKLFNATLTPDSTMAPYWKIADITGDDVPEILYMPGATTAADCSGWLFVYSKSGDSLFSMDCSIRLKYPGDTVSYGKPLWIEAPAVEVLKISGKTRIVTWCCRNLPARGYIKIWDTEGHQLGWYVHSGDVNFLRPYDVDGDGKDELIGNAFGNRDTAQAIFVLPTDSLHGVSPPYRLIIDSVDTRFVERGNQKYYVYFPPSDLGKIEMTNPYQGGLALIYNGPGDWVVHLPEQRGSILPGGDIHYFLNAKFRVTGVTMADSFRKKRSQLITSGALRGVPNEAYTDTLFNHVTYYIDTSLVTEGELRQRGL